MEELAALPDNKICADCSAKDPTWVSINIGVFICIQCAGVHRHLGTHISQVRSVGMDKITKEQVENIKKAGGNKAINANYEKHLSNQKINPRSDLDARESFISAKYEKLLFTNSDQAKTYKVEPRAKGARESSAAGMVEYTGVLFIHLVDAKKLIIADVLSSDPYAVFRVENQIVKSKVIPSSLDPVWNEHLQLSINGLQNTLYCTLYDQDDLNDDDFLGECEVNLTMLDNENIKKNEFVDIVLPLQKVKKGTVHFKLSYMKM